MDGNSQQQQQQQQSQGDDEQRKRPRNGQHNNDDDGHDDDDEPLLRKPSFEVVPVARVNAMLAWESVSGVGRGLHNLGNTCYLNSVMQCLAYCPPLISYLRSKEHDRGCKVMGFCALCTLGRLMQQLHQGGAGGGGGGAVEPMKFVQNLKLIAPSLRRAKQEDAHEWLRYLISACQTVLEKEVTPSNQKVCDPAVAETTWMFRLFGGHILNEVHCLTCGFTSKRADPFMDLSLDISNCKTIADSLALFTAPEKISGSNAWHCEQCAKRVTARKCMKLYDCPPVLTLQLKRFNAFGQKQKKHIVFEPTLDVSKFLATEPKDEQAKAKARYTLFALVQHEGPSAQSGHYTSFARAANGTWFHFNDSSVSRAPLQQRVLASEPYILFYVRDAPKTGNVGAPKAQLPQPPAVKPASENVLLVKPISASASKQTPSPVPQKVAVVSPAKPAVATPEPKGSPREVVKPVSAVSKPAAVVSSPAVVTKPVAPSPVVTPKPTVVASPPTVAQETVSPMHVTKPSLFVESPGDAISSLAADDATPDDKKKKKKRKRGKKKRQKLDESAGGPMSILQSVVSGVTPAAVTAPPAQPVQPPPGADAVVSSHLVTRDVLHGASHEIGTWGSLDDTRAAKFRATQEKLKAQRLQNGKRKSLMDPELDAGKTKKVKSKSHKAAAKSKKGFGGAHMFDKMFWRKQKGDKR